MSIRFLLWMFGLVLDATGVVSSAAVVMACIVRLNNRRICRISRIQTDGKGLSLNFVMHREVVSVQA